MNKVVVRVWKQKSGQLWLVCLDAKHNMGVLAPTLQAGVRALVAKGLPQFEVETEPHKE
jgi:hypothetical protein